MPRIAIHRRLRLSAVIGVGFAVLAGVSQGQIIYGGALDDGNLYLLNIATNTSSTLIEQGPWDNIVTGIAADEAGRRFFVSRNTTLWSVDYDTLVPTVVSMPGQVNSPLAAGGLAFGDGVLYATNNNDELFTVDLLTGDITSLGMVPGVITTTNNGMGGLDFNPADGRLYALNDNTNEVVSFDPDNLAAGATIVTAYPAGDDDIDALAIGNNRLYMVNDPSDTAMRIFVYDLATQSYLPPLSANYLVGNTGNVAGAAFSLAIGNFPTPTIETPAPTSTALPTVTPTATLIPTDAPGTGNGGGNGDGGSGGGNGGFNPVPRPNSDEPAAGCACGAGSGLVVLLGLGLFAIRRRSQRPSAD